MWTAHRDFHPPFGSRAVYRRGGDVSTASAWEGGGATPAPAHGGRGDGATGRLRAGGGRRTRRVGERKAGLGRVQAHREEARTRSHRQWRGGEARWRAGAGRSRQADLGLDAARTPPPPSHGVGAAAHVGGEVGISRGFHRMGGGLWAPATGPFWRARGGPFSLAPKR